MGNLGSAYCSLGWHQDALVLQEKTLEFRRRAFPENHPRIGVTCANEAHPLPPETAGSAIRRPSHLSIERNPAAMLALRTLYRSHIYSCNYKLSREMVAFVAPQLSRPKLNLKICLSRS